MNIMSLVLIVVVMGGMMFFMNRNQKKQQAKRQEQLNSMRPGADITTIGGLHGKLVSLDETKGTIELDCEGVILTFDRAAVKSVSNPEVVQQPTETVVEEASQTAESAIEEN